MIAYFADTSYFLALLMPQDENHAAAVTWARASKSRLITTEYILVEVANSLSSPKTRGLFAAFLQVLRSNTRAEIVPAASQLTWEGIDLFLARQDKAWSLTDCISFTVMRDHGIIEALTADHHFEQAGFACLLNR